MKHLIKYLFNTQYRAAIKQTNKANKRFAEIMLVNKSIMKGLL